MSQLDDIQDRIRQLSLGFRDKYLTAEQVERQIRTWAAAFPHVARVEEIGRSTEGRPLLVLTIGSEPDRVRPSVWVDGNMHASELCGSSVALAIAEDFLRLSVATPDSLHGLPSHVLAQLRDLRVFVMPRMCPDGAEQVLTDGRYVRSNPRDHRTNRSRSYWQGQDIDGDGRALAMRVVDPLGEYALCADRPGLLLPRRIEDSGPFYKIYPEGLIEGFDGERIPNPHYLQDNSVDLNRNFPFFWAPEHEQIGAGDYPASEPESRAVIEFANAHPEIFAWLNLHTFGGVIIRPLADAPDRKMNPHDLAVYRQVEEWSEQLSGYPTVSGFEEFTYEPDKPIHGDLVEYVYQVRGALAYVVELWDLFAELGIPRKKPFVDHYSQLTRADLVKLYDWDHAQNHGRIFGPWIAAVHPQLGEVECGGIDLRVGITNPPYEKLAEVCAEQSAHFFRVAAMSPRMVTRTLVTSVGPGLVRVDVYVENHGYLPTSVLASAKKLDWNEPIWAEVQLPDGVELSAGKRRIVLGHLDGYSRGLFGDSIFFPRSRGNGGQAHQSWVISGVLPGKNQVVTVQVGSVRMGFAQHLLDLDRLPV